MPAHDIFHTPLSDALYGVSGSSASDNAASTDASGTVKVRAGSRLIELTARFSQSFVCALQSAKSYHALVIHAVVYAVASTLIGITMSYYFGLKPGGTIILIETAILIVLLVAKGATGRRAVSKQAR